jgi:glycosyltransferase involved in cell wall biosynthesis
MTDSRSLPLVSIVTPMYNEIEHLEECIQSVLKQTYKNWEYIIVDNCSTDGSTALAKSYADKDPRIRVVENERFVKAIANFNGALNHISPASKYCKIVFGDDWIFPECLERLVAVAEAHPSVGIVGAYVLEGTRVVNYGLPYSQNVCAGREICRRLFLEVLYVFGTGTSVLYRSDLVRSRVPFYNDKNIHSDMEACVALLRESDFGFVHQVLTFTRVRERSIITMGRDMNTYAASSLQQLVTYGPQFLTEAELRECVTRAVSEYYRYLGGSFLGRRDKSFWDYHVNTLRQAGVGFSRLRLARSVLGRICSSVLNLQQTIEILSRRREREREMFLREVAE